MAEAMAVVSDDYVDRERHGISDSDDELGSFNSRSSSSEVDNLERVEDWEDIEDSRQYLAEQHEANFNTMVQTMERRAENELDEGETIDLVTLRPVKAPRRDYPDPWKNSEVDEKPEPSTLVDLDSLTDSESEESDSLSVVDENEEISNAEVTTVQAAQPTPFHTACKSGSKLLDRIVAELTVIAHSS